ncbi:MAG: peptidoglycan bridge formation glycyltransferase FemA/FemB family protein [Peptococcia bacterium]
MYHARLITENEKELFNSYVSQAPKGHILQSYEWGEIKGRGEWEPLRLLIEDEKGIPQAALSILKRKIPIIKKTIFYAPRGPVGDINNEPLMDFLFAAAQKIGRQHGAIFLKIDPDVTADNKDFREYLRSRGFQASSTEEGFEGIQPRFVFRLDITPDEESLLSNFHQKTRYNVRLANRKGVKIKEDCSKDELPVFYEILKETTERDKFLVRPYQYFSLLWDYLTPPGYLKLFMAYYQGKPIAGTIAFLYGDKAWYIYGASSNSHRNVMPNYLLQWTMIKWAKDNNCTMYDFRGVPGDVPEDHPLYGLVRFKKGFNGEYTEFVGEYDLVFSPLFYQLWTKSEPFYQRNIRRLIALKKKLGGQN